MKKQRSRVLPIIASGIVPAAAVTTGMSPSSTFAGAGDFDPDFGDVGRLGPLLNGPAWSVQQQDDGSLFMGGGRPGYTYDGWGYYRYPPTNFVGRLMDDGSLDPGFASAEVEGIQVIDVARQPDGFVVAVGRKGGDDDPKTTQMAAFRLGPDGALDATFGTDGIFELTGEEHGTLHLGSSVVLDPEGRIVIAGTRTANLIVLRLLPNGVIDESFGESGIFVGPENHDTSYALTGARTSILRTPEGGYRVTATNLAGCQLIGLTADGMVDEDFGASGISTARAHEGQHTQCNSMTSEESGSILVAGSAVSTGFVTRILADGQVDPGFSSLAVSGAYASATAIATGNGAIVVAGTSGDGGSIMRLDVNGNADGTFGNAGLTPIELQYEYSFLPIVHDMVVQPNGRIIAVGDTEPFSQAFVVRLLGDSGGPSPGVLGVRENYIDSSAEGSEIVVNVRRFGGASGEVSASLELLDPDEWSAKSGVDFDLPTERLNWADGDSSDRQVRIAIHADDEVEEFENFLLRLGQPEGGVGLGHRDTYVGIRADGHPHGQVNLEPRQYTAAESGTVSVRLNRNYYTSGAISVTLVPEGGTATAGLDFDASPVTVTWADGDALEKFVQIPLIDDTNEEPTETFTVRLESATGGAVIAEPSSVTVHISGNDAPSSSSDNGGGGALGFLSLLSLGIASCLRRVRRNLTEL